MNAFNAMYLIYVIIIKYPMDLAILLSRERARFEAYYAQNLRIIPSQTSQNFYLLFLFP